MTESLQENAKYKNVSYKRPGHGIAWTPHVFDPSQNGSNFTSSEMVRSNIITAELDALPEAATVDELIAIIGPLTCDRGGVMRAVAAEELDEFGEVASAAWRSREEGSEGVLVQKHEHLHRHYGCWSARMEARAEKCRQMILESCPDFDVQRYRDDPDYLRQLVLEKNGEQFNDRVKAWKQNNRDHLAYLRAHTQRLEAEHEELRQQLAQLRQKHKSVQQSQAARDQQLIHENESIENDCKLTKARIAENSKKIDSLLLELEKSEKKSVVRHLDFDGQEFQNLSTKDEE